MAAFRLRMLSFLIHGKLLLAMDHLALSLLNTARRSPDPLETPLGAAVWWSFAAQGAAALPLRIDGKPRFDAVMTVALRSIRAALSDALAGKDATMQFTGTERDALLLPVVHSALRLLGASTSGRLKICALASCGLRYLDETKNGSRRWCSMRCMERARAPRRRTIAR